MSPKKIPEAKVLFLSKIPESEFLSFYGEIPRKAAQDATAHIFLKSGGFTGYNAAVAKFKVIRRNLVANHTKDRLGALGGHMNLWVQWIISKTNLNNALKLYDNEGDRQVPPNSAIDIGCFEHLLKCANEFQLNKKLVADFYKFGYFLQDETIDALIDKLPDVCNNVVTSAVEEEVPKEIRKEVVESESTRALRFNIKEIRVDVRVLSERVGLLNTSLDNEKGRTKKVEASVESLKKNLKDIDESKDTQIVELKEGLAKISARLDRSDDVIANYEKKLSQLEKRVSDLGAKIQSGSRDNSSDQKFLSFAARQISSDVTIDNSKKVSIESLFDILTDNLNVLGISGPSASILTTDILWALSVGQIPVFSGAYADEVCNAAAAACGGGNFSTVEVPMGLVDGAAIQTIFDGFLSKGGAGVLVLKGINRSPIEIYASKLLEMSRSASRDVNSRIFPKVVFATLTPSPGGLPLYGSLTEVGPVLDLDCFNWTTNMTTGKLKSLKLESNMREGLKDFWKVDVGHLPDEVDQCRRAFDSGNSVSWKDMLRAICSTSHIIPASSDYNKNIGLICGWLLPRSHASGVSSSAALATIKDFFGEEVAADARVRKTAACLVEKWY